MRGPSALIATLCLCNLASAAVIEHVAPRGKHGGLTKTPRDKEFWYCAEIAKHSDSHAIDAAMFWECMLDFGVAPLQLSFLYASIDELHVLARGPVLPYIEKDRARCISNLDAKDNSFIEQAAVVVRSIVAATMRQPIGAIDVFQMMIVSLCNFLDKHDATFDYTALGLSGDDYIGHVMEVLTDMKPFHTSNLGFDDALNNRATTTISNLKQFGLIFDIQQNNLDSFHFEDPEDHLFSQEEDCEFNYDHKLLPSMTKLERSGKSNAQSGGFYTCTTSSSIRNLSELAPKTQSTQPNSMFANRTVEQDLEKSLSLLFQDTNEDQGSSIHSTNERTFPYQSRQTGSSNRTTQTFSHADGSLDSSFEELYLDSGSDEDTIETQSQLPKNTSSLQLRGLQGLPARRTFASQWSAKNQAYGLELQHFVRNATTSGSSNLPSSSTSTTTRHDSYTGSDTMFESIDTSNLPSNLKVTRTPIASQSTGAFLQSSTSDGSKSDIVTDKIVNTDQVSHTQTNSTVNTQGHDTLQFGREKLPQHPTCPPLPASKECSSLTSALKSTSAVNLQTALSLEQTITTTSASCGSKALNTFPFDNGRAGNFEHFKVGKYNPKKEVVQDILKKFKANKAALSGMSAKESNRNQAALKSKQLLHSNNTELTNRSSTPENIFKTVSLNESGYHANFPIKRSLEISIIPIKGVVSNDEDSSEEEIAQVDFDADYISEFDIEPNDTTSMPNSVKVNQFASGSKDTTPEVDEPIVFPVSESFFQPCLTAAYKTTPKKDGINGNDTAAVSNSLGSHPNAKHGPEVPDSAQLWPKIPATKNLNTATTTSSGSFNSKSTVNDPKLTPGYTTTPQRPNLGTAPRNAVLPHTTNTNQSNQTSTNNENTNSPSLGKTDDREGTVTITGPPKLLRLKTTAASNNSYTKISKSNKQVNEPKPVGPDSHSSNRSSKRNSKDDWGIFDFEDDSN